MVHFTDLLIALVTILVVIGLHFEILSATSRFLRRAKKLSRFRVALAVIAALAAHSIEVIVFALMWVALDRISPGRWNIANPNFNDLVYYSFATFTSLGYGDMVSLGGGRIVSGIQGLTGLVLIGWTASFTYLEMRECWIWNADNGEQN